MQLPTHWVLFAFSFPRDRKWYIFIKPCKVPAVFLFINLSGKGSLFFGHSLKHLSAYCLKCKHRRFYMYGYFHRTCFVHTRRPRTVWQTSHKANEFLVQPSVNLQESHYETFHAYFRLLQSCLIASMKQTYVRDTRPFSNSTPPSQLRTNRIRIKWQTWSWLEHTASATRGYNVHICIQLFYTKLDESWELLQWPSKSLLHSLPLLKRKGTRGGREGRGQLVISV